MRDLNLNAMVQFEAVARLGGVTQGASELGVSPSAVSQQIRGLEQQLGVKLFVRQNRSVALTIDGERLYQTATQAFGSIREVRNAILRQRESYKLNIRVSPSVGERWLAPRLPDFVERHPEWELRIDATPNFTEFETEAVDLDLRYGEGAWPGVYTQCVMRDFVLPMCSPSYLETLRNLSRDPRAQLVGATLIDSVKSYVRWDSWLSRNGVRRLQSGFPLHIDRSSMAISMACNGAGVVLESVTLALRELQQGALVILSPVFEPIEMPAYWLVCPARHMSRRPVQVFCDWVGEQAADHSRQASELLTKFGLS